LISSAQSAPRFAIRNSPPTKTRPPRIWPSTTIRSPTTTCMRSRKAFPKIF
jgi:hypothetical protein